MESTIVALNSKPIPKATPEQPKSPASTPKLVSKTAFPQKALESTRPPKREPGHGEVGGSRRSSRRTTRPSKPESRLQTKSSEVAPASRPRTPRVSEELERRFRNLELGQKNLVEQTRTRGELEYLAVAKDSSEEYWIAVAGTGKPFVKESFATPGFCLEVAIDENFEMEQIIELNC